jgi:hypothetical protein
MGYLDRCPLHVLEYASEFHPWPGFGTDLERDNFCAVPQPRLNRRLQFRQRVLASRSLGADTERFSAARPVAAAIQGLDKDRDLHDRASH